MARAFSGVNIRSGRPLNLLSYRDLRINSSCENKRIDQIFLSSLQQDQTFLVSEQSLRKATDVVLVQEAENNVDETTTVSRSHETSHHHLIRAVFECSNPDKKSHHHFKYHHHHHHHQIIIIITMRQNAFLSWLKTHIICRLARPVRADWGRVASWLSYRILTVWIIVCTNNCYYWQGIIICIHLKCWRFPLTELSAVCCMWRHLKTLKWVDFETSHWENKICYANGP